MPFDFPGEESPKVYTPEGRRLRSSLKAEAEFKQAAEQAKAKLESLAGKPEDDRERLLAAFALEEANLNYEIFDLTHDPTGALKREASGADLARMFETKFQEQSESEPHVGPREHVTPVFLVNMGELDRLNKKSNGLGNKALDVLAERLTGTVSSALSDEATTYGVAPEELFKVFRADSNSFFVHFEKQIPKVKADAIRELVTMEAGASWANGEEDPFVRAKTESPPVIADYVSLEDTLAVMPAKLLPKKNKPEQEPDSDPVNYAVKAETYAVGALRDTLFTIQEAHKIVDRTKRILTLVNAGKEQEASALYEEYLKKSLDGVYEQATGPEGEITRIEEFEPFVSFIKTHQGQGVFEKQAFEKALTDLRKRYEKDEAYSLKLQTFVAKKAKEEWEVSAEPRSPDKDSGKKLPAAVQDQPFQYPSLENATEGLRVIATLRTEAAFERRNLERAKTQDASPEEIERLTAHLAIAEKKVKRELVLRNPATGLEQRGQLFKRLESALADSSKRVGMVSIDMGFLKYFDQVGGQATGDLAILTAAAIMQRVKDKFSSKGIEIGTHRLGGDELGLAVIGDASISPEDFSKLISDVQAELKTEALNTGGIPPQEGAKPGYYQTKLSFGVGAHLYQDGAAAEAEDAKYALTTNLPKEMQANKRAEHLLAVADKVMEFKKAAGRMKDILELKATVLGLERSGSDPEKLERLKAQYQQVVFFSTKGMFGEPGEDKLKELEAKLAQGKTPEELDDEIHAFVGDAMEAKYEKMKAEKQDLESFVEYAVRIEYLNGRIEELTKKLETVTDEGDRRKHQIKTLEEKKKSAEADLEKIRTLRAAL